MSPLITILANLSNTFGISHDVDAVRKALGGQGFQIRVCDPLEPPSFSDVLIHIEQPIYGWMPWATKNILVVNTEWYVPSAWNPYLEKFDAIVVKDTYAGTKMQELTGKTTTVIPWGMPESTAALPPAKKLKDEFLWVLAGSLNKRPYVPTLLRFWRSTYPNLLITTTSPLDLSGIEVPANVTVRVEDFSKEEREKLFPTFKGHICCSRAEGFGYTAAEAEATGAFTILNSLPVYKADYQGKEGVAFLPSHLEGGLFDTCGQFDTGSHTEEFQKALDNAMIAFAAWTPTDRATRVASSKQRWAAFKESFAKLVKGFVIPRAPLMKVLPPPLMPDNCPPITVVTLVYNRKKFFDLACHNMMISDYPKDKIEWIIVDDSDNPKEQNSDGIIAVMNKAAPINACYVPLPKKKSVAEKRNIGVERATNDIILMMDDDDHYPETSFRRRVGWLVKHPWAPRCTAATTIACYDLLKGVSSVNSPPMSIPLGQRISEATLTFYKSWWAQRKFPDGVQVGEAEDFIKGRETDVLELPPQQIIVAFSHGENVSSRRIPAGADLKVGCFWGFPKEFLIFVHGLAGVTVNT